MGVSNGGHDHPPERTRRVAKKCSPSSWDDASGMIGIESGRHETRSWRSSYMTNSTRSNQAPPMKSWATFQAGSP